MNALFNCDEMNTPLPTSTTLWNATTAAEWLEALAHDSVLGVQQPLPLSRVLRHPHLLVASAATADYKFGTSAYLAGYWGLIEEYWRMIALVSGAQSSNDFVLNSRHSELSSTLEQFRADLADQYDRSVEILILQELVSLHLHVSSHDIAQYCGNGTNDDARASAPFVQRWYQTSQARAAVWHAGQVFRATELLSAGALTDIYVTALYHVALILWIWGILSRVQPVASASSRLKVVIDGEETPGMVRFLKTGRCQLYLTDKSGKTFTLEDSAMAPDLAKDIITTNWDREPMPLTTAQTFRFMHEISEISFQKFGTSHD